MGVYEVKSRKGLIRVQCISSRGLIRDLRITGDFFIYPEDSLWFLEEKLKGLRIRSIDELEEFLNKLLKSKGVELVGSTPRDFAEAIYCACTNSCGD